MKKRKFNKWIILGVLLLILLIAGGLVLKNSSSKKDNADVIVKDNVHTITRKTDFDKQPETVKENELLFSKKPKYKKGDIIVAGI